MFSPQWYELFKNNHSKVNSGCFHFSELFRTPYGDETASLRYMEHSRLRTDTYWFDYFDRQVTSFLLREKKIKEERDAWRRNDGLPLSTATKCHSCAKLVEIGNNTITCGPCVSDGKANVKFESYFVNVDYFNKRE